MISHLSFGTVDLAAAIIFYDAALAPLGLARVWADDRAAGYGCPGGDDIFAVKQQDKAVQPPGPGFHLAFAASDRAAVDAFYAAALSNGGRDAGAPGLRLHYSPTYYAAFVIDPAGYLLEAVHQ